MPTLEELLAKGAKPTGAGGPSLEDILARGGKISGAVTPDAPTPDVPSPQDEPVAPDVSGVQPELHSAEQYQPIDFEQQLGLQAPLPGPNDVPTGLTDAEFARHEEEAKRAKAEAEVQARIHIISGQTQPVPVEQSLRTSDPSYKLLANEQTLADAQRIHEIFSSPLASSEDGVDSYSTIMALRKKTGLDYSTLAAKLPEFEAQWKQAQVDPLEWMRKNPQLAEYVLRNPEAGVMVKYDPGLDKLSKTWNEISKVFMPSKAEKAELVRQEQAQGKTPDVLQLTPDIALEGPSAASLTTWEESQIAAPAPGLAIQTPESQKLNESGSGLLMVNQRAKEAAAGMDANFTWWEVAKRRSRGEPTALLEQRALDLESLAQPRDLHQGEWGKVATSVASGAVSSYKVLEDVAKGASGGALITGTLGGAVAALATKNPYAFVPGFLEAAPIGGKLGGKGGAYMGTMRLEGGAYYRELKQQEKWGDGTPITEQEAFAGMLILGNLNAALEVGALELSLPSFGALGQLIKTGSRKAAVAALLGRGATGAAFRASVKRFAKQLAVTTAAESGEEGEQNLTKQATSYFLHAGSELVSDIASGKELGLEKYGKALGKPIDLTEGLRDTLEAVPSSMFLGVTGEVSQHVQSAAIGAALQVAPIARVAGAQVRFDLSPTAQNQAALEVAHHVMLSEEAHEGAAIVKALADLDKEESPTTRADPEGVAHAFKQGGLGENVYTQPEQLVKWYQDQKLDIEQTAKKDLGEDGYQKLKEALATGQPVAIPTSTFIGWDLEQKQALHEHTTTKPNLPTASQIDPAKFKAKVDELVKRMEEEHVEPESAGEAAFLKVAEDDLANLPGASRLKARQKLDLFRAHVRTYSEVWGQDPNELFSNFSIRVSAGQEQTMEEVLRKRLATMTASARAEEYLRDQNTGLPNELAMAMTPTPSGMQVAHVSVEGIKWLNDNVDHEHADGLYRAVALALHGAGLKPYKAFGDFAFHVKDQATLDTALEAVRKAMPENLKGFAITGALGANLAEAGKANEDASKAAIEAGTKAHPRRPVHEVDAKGAPVLDEFGAPKLVLDELGNPEVHPAEMPKGLKPGTEAKSIAFAEEKPTPALATEAVKQVTDLKPEDYFDKSYLNPVTGEWTARAWDAMRRKAHVVSIDLRGLRGANERFGKDTGNLMLQRMGLLASELGGKRFDFTRLHGDEYAAQSDNAEELELFVDELRAALRDHSVEFKDDETGELTLVPITFHDGFGERSLKLADADLNERKKARKKAREAGLDVGRNRPARPAGDTGAGKGSNQVRLGASEVDPYAALRQRVGASRTTKKHWKKLLDYFEGGAKGDFPDVPWRIESAASRYANAVTGNGFVDPKGFPGNEAGRDLRRAMKGRGGKGPSTRESRAGVGLSGNARDMVDNKKSVPMSRGWYQPADESTVFYQFPTPEESLERMKQENVLASLLMERGAQPVEDHETLIALMEKEWDVLAKQAEKPRELDITVHGRFDSYVGEEPQKGSAAYEDGVEQALKALDREEASPLSRRDLNDESDESIDYMRGWNGALKRRGQMAFKNPTLAKEFIAANKDRVSGYMIRTLFANVNDRAEWAAKNANREQIQRMAVGRYVDPFHGEDLEGASFLLGTSDRRSYRGDKLTKAEEKGVAFLKANPNGVGRTELARAITTSKTHGSEVVEDMVRRGLAVEKATPGERVRSRIYPVAEMPESKNLPGQESAESGVGARGLSTVIGGAVIIPPGYTGKVVLEQPAFHGSPHRFEKFELHKIGTGEGAQVFGWGMYFAQLKHVAEQYRDTLSESPEVKVDGVAQDRKDPQEILAGKLSPKEIVVGRIRSKAALAFARRESPTAEQMKDEVGDEVARAWESHDKLLRQFEKNTPDPENSEPVNKQRRLVEKLKAQLKALEELDSKKIELERTGRLYQVEVPENDELLDYDALLADQPPKLRDRLEALWESVESEDASGKNPTGGHLYRVLAHLEGPQGASETLREAGIPGLRYSDQGSRGKPGGTYNFVIWDESRMPVVRFEQTDKKNLLVQHNLSAENLLHADELGGLAAPSLAITRKEHPLENFGEVTLLGSPLLADPETTPVFDADVYSPRYPTTGFKVDAKAARALIEELTPFAKPLGGYLSNLDNELEEDGVDVASKRSLKPTLELAWLTEHGKAPELPMAVPEAKYPGIVDAPGVLALVEAKLEKDQNIHFRDEDEVAFKAAINDAIAALPPDDDTHVMREVTEDWVDEKGEIGIGKVDLIAREARRFLAEKKGIVDRYKAEDVLKEAVDKEGREAFEQWAETKVKRALKGQFIKKRNPDTGNVRRIPYTLENVLKEVTRKIRQGEDFNYGLGTARAAGAKKFRNLDQVKKARDKIKTEEEFRKRKDEMDARFGSLADKLQQYHTNPGGFHVLDGLAEAIGESYKRGHYLYRELAASQFANVPDTVVKEVGDFAADLLAMPTTYFEAKPQRIVRLSEFAGAVVPEDTKPEVLKALERAEVPVFTYKKGDDAGRRQAIARASGTLNILFSGPKNSNEGPRGYTEPPEPEALDRLYKIVLNPNADLSTFLHESAHVFLDHLRHLAMRQDAPARVRADFAAALKYLGAKNGDDLLVKDAKDPKDPARLRHEKWAQNFEHYLYEGNAPSDKLEGAFARYRMWLSKVYGNVKSAVPGADINDDIRKVFDRLLATDAEIANRQKAMGANAPSARQLLGLSLEGFREHLEQWKDATSYTRKRETMAVMKDLLREKEGWWKEELKEQRDKAKDDYELLPARLVQQAMMNKGELKMGALDRAKVEAVLGKEATKKLGATSTKPDGQDPDAVAAFFKYDSAKSMLEDLSKLPDKTAWANATADSRMAQAHPELLAEIEKLHEAVDKGLHGDLDAKQLDRELVLMSTNLTVPGTPLHAMQEKPEQTVRAAARAHVEQRNVDKLNATQALAAERRSATQAAEEGRKGNLSKAFVKFVERVTNFHIWKNLLEAREMLADTLALAGKLGAKKAQGELGKASPVYRDQVSNALGELGFGDDTGEVFSIEAVINQMKKDNDEGRTLVEVLDAEKISPVFAKLARLGIGRPKGQAYKVLTVSEMRVVKDMLEAIKAAAKNVTTVEVEGKKLELQEASEQTAAAIRKGVPPLPPRPQKGAGKVVDDLGRYATAMSVMQERPETWLLHWLGGVENYAWKAIGKPLQQAKHEEVDLLEGPVKKLVESYEKIPFKVAKRSNELIPGDKLFPQMATAMSQINETAITRRWQFLEMLKHMGNSSNEQKMCDGFGISPQQVWDAALKLGVTKEEWDHVQSTWDSAESLKQRAFDLEEKDTGIRPEEIVARPVQTPYGTYRGGYHPIAYHPNTKEGARHLESLQPQGFASIGTSNGSLINRVDFTGIVSLDPYQIQRHLLLTVHDIAFRRALRSVALISRSKDVQAALLQHLGEERTKALEKWLQDIGQLRNVDDPKVLYSTMQVLRGAMSSSVLGYSFGNTMEDLVTGVLGAMPGGKIRPDHWAAGMKFVTMGPVNAIQILEGESGELRSRHKNLNRELSSATRKLVSRMPAHLKVANALVKDHAFVMAEVVDRLVSAGVYAAAKAQALDGNVAPTEAQETLAIEEAEAAVRLLMPGGHVVDSSAIMRSQLGSAFLVFFRFFNTQYNITRAHTGRDIFKGKSAQNIAIMGAVLFANVFAYSILGSLARGQGPEKGEKWGRWFFRKMATGAAGQYVFGTELSEFAWPYIDKATGGAGKKRPLRNNSITGMLEAVGELIGRALSGDKTIDQRALLLGSGIGLGTGTVPAQSLKTASYLSKLYHGDVHPRGGGDVLGGLFYGQNKTPSSNPFTILQDIESGEWPGTGPQ